MLHGSVILTAKLTAGYDAEGERGIPARMIRMPPVSSIWIPGRRLAPAPRGLQRAGPRQAAMPGYAAAELAAAVQAVRAQEDAAARSVRLPVPASR